MMGDAAAATATRSLDRAERAVTDALARRLAAAYPEDLLEVRVFGSRARGDHREDSDLDVAVIVEKLRPARTEVMDLAWAAGEETDYPHLVDTHLLSLSGFRHFQATNSLYYRSMRDDGITIWRRAGPYLWDEAEVEPMGRESDVEEELRKAKLDLARAQRDLRENDPDGVGHSAYYAVFHAVKAALLTRNLEAKTHRGVQALFSQHFVKPAVVPSDYGAWLSRLETLRYHADYPDQWGYEPLDRKQVAAALTRAEEMVAQMERLCRDWLAREPSGPAR